MRIAVFALMASLMIISPLDSLAQTKTKKVKKKKFKDFNQTLSYTLGLNIAENFQMQGFTLDPAMVAEGLKDFYSSGKNAIFTDQQLDSLFTEYNKRVQEYTAAKTAQEKTANEAAGTTFLEDNGKKDSVVTTTSGLQYKVITEGTGAKPTATSTVRVHYKGTLLDGTQFDSSYDRGTPTEFPLNGVIKGWTEGLQLMPVGSKYIFYIPSSLAYGDRGAGGQIKPGMTLIFEVELLAIVSQ